MKHACIMFIDDPSTPPAEPEPMNGEFFASQTSLNNPAFKTTFLNNNCSKIIYGNNAFKPSISAKCDHCSWFQRAEKSNSTITLVEKSEQSSDCGSSVEVRNSVMCQVVPNSSFFSTCNISSSYCWCSKTNRGVIHQKMALIDVRNRKANCSQENNSSVWTWDHEIVNGFHIKNTGRRKSPDGGRSAKGFHNAYIGQNSSSSCPSETNRTTRNSETQTHLRASGNTRTFDGNPSEGQQSHMWLYMTVWMASVVAYINGLTGDFVHDDLSAITSNPDVTGKNPFYQVFINDYWGRPLSHPLSHKSYRPLTILTFRMTHSVVGLSSSWYHLGNVALHSTVCILFSRLLTRLLKAPAALTPVLIFATHPIHTEAVTGIVGRADLLAALCLLMALLAYHNGLVLAGQSQDEGRVWSGVRWAGVWTLLGTLCKEHAITALLLCCAWDCCHHRRLLTWYFNHWVKESHRSSLLGHKNISSFHQVQTNLSQRGSACSGGFTNSSSCSSSSCSCSCNPAEFISHCNVGSSPPLQSVSCTSRVRSQCSSYASVQFLGRRMLWLLLMGASILTLRLWMLRGSSPAFSDQDNPASFSPDSLTRLLTFLYLPALNFGLLLWPWPLSHDWQMGTVPLVASLCDYRNAASLFFYAGLLLVLYKAIVLKGAPCRAVQMGLALLLLPFLPATNIFFRVGFVLAERILYIPSMGYCLLISAGLQRLRRYRVPLLLLLLILFTARTVRRNYDWRSRATLFTAGLRTMPGNAKMHYNYANLQRDLDNTDLAEHHYREAIRLWPNHASAHNNLATLLNSSSEAEHHFRAALNAHPQHAHASYNLAMHRQKQGALDEAITLLETSLRWDALYRDAVCALAELYVGEGRVGEADALHRDLLMATQDDPAAHNNYAAFLQRAGRREAALHHYETALSLDPDHAVALVNTARLLRVLRHDHHAELLYQRALSVSWEAGVGESLGKLYLNTDRLEEAQAAFSAVLARQPDRISTKVYLARVQLQQRHFDATEAILKAVLEEQPWYPDALLQLSLLYAHTNRTQQALTIATAAADRCHQPSSVCAHLLAHRADLLHANRRTDLAQQSYEAALALDSTLSHAHVNLGAIFHSKGDHAQAWHHYLTAQSHDPTNSLLLENMDKLKKSHQPLPPLTPLNCLTLS